MSCWPWGLCTNFMIRLLSDAIDPSFAPGAPW
jgi:hypothetical protein